MNGLNTARFLFIWIKAQIKQNIIWMSMSCACVCSKEKKDTESINYAYFAYFSDSPYAWTQTGENEYERHFMWFKNWMRKKDDIKNNLHNQVWATVSLFRWCACSNNTKSRLGIHNKICLSTFFLFIRFRCVKLVSVFFSLITFFF